MVDPTKLITFTEEERALYRGAGLWGERTIGDELRWTAAQHPDVEAVVTSERRLTYAELDARVDAIAAKLVGIGLKAGDPVLLQVGNTVETVEAFYGLIRMGAAPVCSLIPFGHHEMDTIGRIVGARAHLVQADHPGRDLVSFAREVKDAVPTVEHVLTIRGEATGATRLDDAKPVDSPPDFSHLSPDDVAVFQLSGGTTGTPKVIPRLHAEYWYNGLATARRNGLVAGERAAHFMPLVHNAGIHLVLFAAHSVGATAVLAPTWVPDQVLDFVAQERVDFFITNSPLLAPLLADARAADVLGNVRRIGLLPDIPEAMYVTLTGWGVDCCQFYGMSEGFACGHPVRPSREMARNSIGYPLSELDEYQVLETDSERPVPSGTMGELCVRGPYTLRGYYDAADHNAVSFTSQGFLRTGDLVEEREIDGRMCLALVGRHKDLINRGGEKINAAEVEALLLQMPGIRSAAVVAMPDLRLGEKTCAFLVGEAGALPDLDEVRTFFAGKGVAKYKWPERLERIDALPLTPVGKVSKAQLREEVVRRMSAKG